MPRLKLHLLGAPRVERDGTPVEVDTRKAIALVAYLAVTGEPHSRDALAALLWPDYDQAHARATLRRTLSALNKALGGEWLDAGRETVSLGRADVWLDVEEFAGRAAGCANHRAAAAEGCAACLEPLAEAAELYRGDFMAGFTLRDSPSFDDWQFFQAEGLRRDLAAVLERLARCSSARGEHERAIDYARRWLALDPLHEPVHRELMRLFAAAGRRSAALHQYRECVRVLDKELGVPPLEETTQLYQAIKEGRLADGGPKTADEGPMTKDQGPKAGDERPKTSDGGAPSAAPSPPSTVLGPRSLVHGPSSQLVGRDAEWAALLGAYAGIGADGHLAVLEGEGGIGKTRLAEELLAYARARGGAAVAVRCYEGEGDLAYGPLAAGLRQIASPGGRPNWHADVPPHHLSEAARLLPELAARAPGLPPAPPLDGPGAQNRFFEGLSQVLLAACRGPAPGVLFIDDLHWADASSLDLLTYFVRRLQGRPLLVLATWRSEHVPPGHRLRQLLAEAQRGRSVTAVALGRLGPEAVEALVRSAGAVELPPDFGQQLHRETEGLPLFVVEYLAALAHGAPSGGEWPLPSSVRDVLHARLAAVGETEAQLLATAAVIGRSFDFDTLREASGRGEEEAVAALERLIALGMVAEARGGQALAPTYDFSHEKLRALVYAETSLARRRLLHRRVADALAARGHARRDGTAGQIAHHYREAGQDALAADHFRTAGGQARALYANAEALAHYRAALALGHPSAAALQEAIGDLHTLRGEYAQALISYETAAAVCAPEDLPALERKLGGVHHRRGAWDLAESHFQAALAALGEGGPAGERARVLADWSLTAHLAARPDAAARAGELAGRALELAERGGDARALAQSLNICGVLASGRGDLGAARAHLERSLRLAAELGDQSARLAALNNLALACGAAAEHARALELGAEALRLAGTLGDRHREAALHNNLADLLHAAGRSDQAMAHLKQAVAIYAEIGVEAGALRPEIWRLAEW